MIIPWSALAATLAGTVARPGEQAYASAQPPFVIDANPPRPLAIARCANPADVAEAITFARRHALPIALRGGAHSYAGHSSTTGLLIDLSELRSIRLAATAAVIGAGTRIGSLGEYLAARGRALSCGGCPSVCVGGAVLGGGYGPLGRSHGLASDRLLSAEVVLASGRVATVDSDHEPDLFWALRGAGGGRFAAVTALTLRTEPASTVTNFWFRWPYADARTIIETWQRWAPDAPDAVTAELTVAALETPHEPAFVALYGSAVAGATETDTLTSEFLDLAGAQPESSELVALSPAEAARCHAGPASATHTYRPDRRTGAVPPLRRSKSEFFDRAIPPTAIGAVLSHLASRRIRGQQRFLEFTPWAGAYARVPPAATAFAHRAHRFQLSHTVIALDGAARCDAAAWVRESWRLVHSHAAAAVYPNFPDPDLPAWSPLYHATNAARLRGLKTRYDPDNTFTLHRENRLRVI